jgi:hypothetical protein
MCSNPTLEGNGYREIAILTSYFLDASLNKEERREKKTTKARTVKLIKKQAIGLEHNKGYGPRKSRSVPRSLGASVRCTMLF